MKKGERFRIEIEAGIVLLLAVGVFQFYQVKQKQNTRDKEAPSLSGERGLGKLIKMRADGKEESERTQTSPQPENRNRGSETVAPAILPEPALLVIQVVDREGSAFLEPFTIYSRQARFTNRVTSGRLALSLSAMELKVAGRWDEFPSVAIEPVSVALIPGKTTGVVLVVDPGVLPGFDLARDNALLVVSRIDAGSPAALAGLQINDIVVEVAGIPIEQLNDAALLGVLESPLTEPLELTVAEAAGDGWTAVSVILQP